MCSIFVHILGICSHVSYHVAEPHLGGGGGVGWGALVAYYPPAETEVQQQMISVRYNQTVFVAALRTQFAPTCSFSGVESQRVTGAFGAVLSEKARAQTQTQTPTHQHKRQGCPSKGFATPNRSKCSRGRSLLHGHDMGKTQHYRNSVETWLEVGGWRLAVVGGWLSLLAVLKGCP